MNREPRIHLFDEWAEHYDQSIRSDCGFPFDGYEQVLDEIVRAAGAQCGMKVLDLGIGTGNVADRFAAIGCDIWGIDFSAEMLAKTTEKLPKAVLVQADLMNEWPTELDQRFDRIVSAYVLHEFGFSAKMKLLQRLTRGHLGQNGRIVVGDIAFPTSRIRDEAHRKWTELWDEEEYYWAADEVVEACKSIGLQVTYNQISSCGGVFVFGPVSSEQACTLT
jgi:putative AdoMet-dependent methyltransferase